MFVAANPPRNGGTEGLAQPERGHPQDGGGAPASLADAEAGMADMSRVFRETGSELYMGAGEREYD